jgi:uncharacterized protein with NRDE domain
MCTILFAHRFTRGYPLVLASNRDEFYERPTAQAGFWADAPRVLGGRDLRSGGTWMGVSTDGRLAAVTNVREPGSALHQGGPSRGELVSAYLQGGAEPQEYLREVARTGDRYSGFNLLLGRVGELYYYSNRGAREAVRVEPGIHGLSNGALDSDWPKVRRGREGMQQCLQGPGDMEQCLFRLLEDESRPPDEELPDTGVGLELERMLSPIFVRSPGYGTRSSTVLLADASGRVRLTERRYAPEPANRDEPPRLCQKIASFDFRLPERNAGPL